MELVPELAGNVKPRLFRLAHGVLRLTLPLRLSSPDHVHCFLLDMPGGGTMLVDCGMRGSEAALHAALDRAEREPDMILITHGHVDHWGLAGTLTREVLAHEHTRASLDLQSATHAFGEHSDGVLTTAMLAAAFTSFRELIVGQPPAVQAIGDGALLGEWRVIWTPGHDPGHLALFRERDGLLICGDTLLPDNTPTIQPAAGRPDALSDFFVSLRRLADLPVSVVLPSHGEPFTDHRSRATRLRRFHERRLATLLVELSGPPRTVGALADALFPQRNGPIDDMLASMETLAHLDHLRLRGLARRHRDYTWTARFEGNVTR